VVLRGNERVRSGLCTQSDMEFVSGPVAREPSEPIPSDPDAAFEMLKMDLVVEPLLPARASKPKPAGAVRLVCLSGECGRTPPLARLAATTATAALEAAGAHVQGFRRRRVCLL
jgi:hypothetical protein